MSPSNLVRVAIVLQAIAGLGVGLPGHLSRDSIVQLFEARTLEFITFQPPMMSLLLRLLDGWLRGTALFVVLDQLLLTFSFALLFTQRHAQLRWPAAIFAGLIVLNPLLIAYTGIVWRDVLMSHLAAFGYVCLYVAAHRHAARTRAAWVVAAMLALAFAASLRQHALILAFPGAVYAASLLSRSGAARLVAAVALCIAMVAINVAIIIHADAITIGEQIPRAAVGMRSLANFDLTGIAANGGAIADAAVAAQLQIERVPFYTPMRNDIIPSPGAESPLSRMETPALLALWRNAIIGSPRAYLLHRVTHFESLLWGYGKTPLCDAIHTGIVSSLYVATLGRDIVPELELKTGVTLRDRRFERFQQRLMSYTPLFNHAFWSAVLIIVAIVLWRRRGAEALVILAASALFFALGFGVVGISCEFRYIYIMPVAASLLMFTLATGPPSETASPDRGIARARIRAAKLEIDPRG